MPAYNRQLEDKNGNILYPIITSDSIPSNAVTTAKIASSAVTEDKIDWTESPCVSTFVFSGTAMPASGNDQQIPKTTRRGTQLVFNMSHNSLYIESGADNIRKVRYSISYRWGSTVTDTFGCTGLATNTTIWSYLTGVSDGGPVNTSNSHTTDSNIYGSICDAYGNKTCFTAVFDVIRPAVDPNYSPSRVWFMTGDIISAGSGTTLMTRCEVTSTTVGTVPAWYQRGVTGTYYYIVVEVWED